MSATPERATPAAPRVQRLRGPNRWFAGDGLLLAVDGAAAPTLDRWQQRVEQLRERLGWPGVSVLDIEASALALEVPGDQFDTAAELASQAWTSSGGDNAEAIAAGLADGAGQWRQPALQELVEGARLRGLPLTIGREHLAIGHGAHGCHWPLQRLPEAAAVPWAELGALPVALVAAGDRCVALLAAMLQAGAGSCGTSMAAGDLDAGERAIGVRRLLRDRSLQAAVIAVSPAWYRDGGLPLRQAGAAVLAAAHDFDDALQVLPRALHADGVLLLDADSPGLAGRAAQVDCVQGWFADSHRHPRLVRHREQHGATCGFDGRELMLCHAPHHWVLGERGDGTSRRGIDLAEAPAAALAAHALQVDAATIGAVLSAPAPA